MSLVRTILRRRKRHHSIVFVYLIYCIDPPP